MNENYQNLITKVESKFSEIVDQYSNQMQCRAGCFSCCRSGLSVSGVEWQEIVSFVDKNHKKLREPDRNEDKSKCEFLDKSGQCRIYDVRPIICRSHGAPILFKNDKEKDLEKDVCPLNFENFDLMSIDENCFINVEIVNTILAMINQMEGYSTTRIPLSLELALDEIEQCGDSSLRSE